MTCYINLQKSNSKCEVLTKMWLSDESLLRQLMKTVHSCMRVPWWEENNVYIQLVGLL